LTCEKLGKLLDYAQKLYMVVKMSTKQSRWFILLLITGLFLSFDLLALVTPLKEAKTSSQAKICLNMIVKNEAAIIERCLNSAKDIIDCVSICDTGSTDNTVAIIEKFMHDNHIPGKVHRHTWQNFGHNRTLSAEAAQKTIEELNFPLANTFLLLLDADMLLEVEPTFKRHALQDDAYLIMQKSAVLSYYNTRLLRASLPWKCVGVTHEYWDCPQARQSQLFTLKIDDREDGGSKSDKFERDIQLLEQGLKDEPNNARYMFYYAQSFKDLKRYPEAIKWYKNRIAQGGWDQEVYWSLLQIAIMQELLEEDPKTVIEGYYKAYSYRPSRVEALYRLANYFRGLDNYQAAYLTAKRGLNTPASDDILFVEHWITDYGLLFEFSIASYWLEKYTESQLASSLLLTSPSLPETIRHQVEHNLDWADLKVSQSEDNQTAFTSLFDSTKKETAANKNQAALH
jgi:glycosyltransferase involved in cell wall biosynthesis